MCECMDRHERASRVPSPKSERGKARLGVGRLLPCLVPQLRGSIS